MYGHPDDPSICNDERGGYDKKVNVGHYESPHAISKASLVVEVRQSLGGSLRKVFRGPRAGIVGSLETRG